MGKSPEQWKKTARGVLHLAVGALAFGGMVGSMERATREDGVIAIEQQLVRDIEEGRTACHVGSSQRLVCERLSYQRPSGYVPNSAEQQVVTRARDLLHDLQLWNAGEGVLAIALGLASAASVSRGYEAIAGQAPSNGQWSRG